MIVTRLVMISSFYWWSGSSWKRFLRRKLRIFQNMWP